MAGLAVNIDHIATLREARKVNYPDPVAAAVLAELAGADLDGQRRGEFCHHPVADHEIAWRLSRQPVLHFCGPRFIGQGRHQHAGIDVQHQ